MSGWRTQGADGSSCNFIFRPARVSGMSHNRDICSPDFAPLKESSFFLFGARGVGKTWLVRELFAREERFTSVELLAERLYLELLADPERLRRFVLD